MNNPVAKNAFKFNKCIAFRGKREKLLEKEKKAKAWLKEVPSDRHHFFN